MSVDGVITLMSLNNWFCPLEEFPQITGCQEHGQDNRNYARCSFWRAWLSFSSGCGGNEPICLSVCHQFYLVRFRSDTSSFTFQKKDLLVFLCRKHRQWKFLRSLWPWLATAETLSHAPRMEKAWHFVNLPKSNSSQYFTQAKVNEKEVLKIFKPYPGLRNLKAWIENLLFTREKYWPFIF